MDSQAQTPTVCELKARLITAITTEAEAHCLARFDDRCGCEGEVIGAGVVVYPPARRSPES